MASNTTTYFAVEPTESDAIIYRNFINPATVLKVHDTPKRVNRALLGTIDAFYCGARF